MSGTTTTPSPGWTIEPLPGDQLEPLAEFQQRACADQFHARFFQDRAAVRARLAWQLQQAPGTDRERLPVWVLRRGERIIGQLVMAPAQVLLHGKPVRAAWCQDFIVDPAHRGQGAGARLLREAVEAVRRDVPLLLVGGTNAQSHPLFCAVGFRDLGPLSRAVGWAPVARWLARGRLLAESQVVVRSAAPDGSEVARWWHTRGAGAGVVSRRDAGWATWRIWRHPHWRYSAWIAQRAGQVDGYLVCREGRTLVRGRQIPTLRVVELAAAAGARQALWSRALTQARASGCPLIRWDGTAAVLPLSAAHRVGLWPVRSEHRFLALAAPELAEAALRSSAAWWLTALDSDFDLYEPAGPPTLSVHPGCHAVE